MKKSSNKVHYYDFGNFRLDVTNRELLRNGEHVSLTQKSFELLEFLVENRGRGLRKNEILNGIWAENFVEEANLAQHVYMVRKVLKDNGEGESFIETIPKYGYRFTGDVTENFVDDSPPEKSEPSPAGDIHISSSAPALEAISEPGTMGAEVDEDNAAPNSESVDLRKWLLLAGVVLAAIGIASYFLYFRSPPPASESTIKAIAILPFSQIGEDPDQKLGLGIADTLISRLGNQTDIAVSPTSTIIKFFEKGTDNPIEIGEQLGVDAVLTGTVQRENDTVRVNVQLIGVKEKTPKWSDRFDAKFSNIFSLQDRVAEQVAKRLSLKLQTPEPVERATKYTDNIEAYQDYTLGLLYWDKRTKDDLQKAIGHFENAIEKDPDFATAYALAADSLSLIGYFNMGSIPANDAITKAKKMANRALELDPNSSEALTALGVVALYEKSPEEAEKLYRKAVRLKPNNSAAHQRLAWMLTTKGNLDSAIVEMEIAQKADPLSLITNINLSRLLRLNRQPHRSENFAKRALEIDPKSSVVNVLLSEIHEQKEEYDRAAGILEKHIKDAPDDKLAKLILARVFAKNGEKKKAQKIVEDFRGKRSADIPSYELATAFLTLGNETEAVKVLKSATDDSLIYYLHIKYDPNLDLMRNSPEYEEILSVTKKRWNENYK